MYQNNPNGKIINVAEAGTSDSWYNTSWLYRKQISIDHTKVVHNDTSNLNPYLSDFPFLVSTNIPINKVRPDYNDIVFTNQTGSQVLSYEIESYDTTSGNLVAWVRLPQLNDANNSTDTIFYMYYDNSGAVSSQQNKAAVWDAGFKDVWHLGENPTVHAVGDYKDSTSPADNSINTTNTPTYTASGKIGGAQTFDGTKGSSSSRIDFGKSVVILNTNFTIDWWSTGTGEGVIGSNSGNKVYVRTDRFGLYSSPNTYSFMPTSLNTSLWHHYVLALAGTSLKGYLDGAQVNELSVDAATAVNVWFIGMNAYWPAYFTGNIDEMRVSTTTRSADWIKAEYNNDANTSGFYTLGGEEDTTPVFSPAAGSYGSSQTVSIATSLPGSTIYYTIDGNTPTTSSSIYSSPLTVASTTTVKAIAVAAGYTSATGSALFTIVPAAATPTFSPAEGTYHATQTVAISTTTPNATIYYTTDGTEPTTGSSVYSTPLTVASTTTFKAITVAAGYTNSATGSALFSIIPFAATPTFSPNAGTYLSAKNVTISTTTPSATIYYTTDGTDPTTSSSVYSSPLTVASTATLKAIATASGYATSAAASALFTINTAGSEVRYGFWGMGLSPSTYQPNWNDNITHIAYHYWNTNADGTLVNPADMSVFNAVRDVTHQHGAKILMGLVSNASNFDGILANHRQDFADNVVNALQSYGADGVNLDFESYNVTNTITQTSNTPLFEDLVRLLNIRLKSANPEYLIVVDTPERIYGISCNSNLRAYVDYFFIMGYDFHLPNSLKAGPVSPYSDPTGYDITETVSQFSKLYDKKQLILGLPLYGYNWPVVSNQMGAATTGNAGSPKMDSAINSAATYGRIWDPISHSPWYRYQASGVWHQVWYDDEESLRLKYDFMKSQNLAGVGFWALSYEGTHPEVLDDVFLDQHHTLTVTNGSGSGSFVQGSTLTITANAPAAGKTFDRWTGDTSYVADADSLSTTITEMPAADIHLTATYKNALSSWYDPAWNYRKAITLNHSKVSADQADFPVFVSITDPALKTAANGGEVHSPNGYDVLFVSSAGQRLDYEIEKYDLTTGEMGVWIRIPALSSAQDTIVYLYYGNSNISSSQESKTNVWDNHSKGVWHMNGSATGHAGDFKDSTISANNNSNATNEPIATTGQMGGAQTFNGTSSRVDFGKTLINLNTNFTVDWWGKGAGDTVIGSNAANKIYSNSSSFGIIGDYNSTWRTYSFTPATIDTSLWHHFALTLAGTKLDGYLDGNLVNELTVDSATSVSVWFIGMNAYWPGYFNGSIDEVRVSDTARTADYIKTEYNDDSDSSGFYSLSGEENYVTTSNATLSNLSISSGTLTPSFASGTTSYAASVTNATSIITLTPTATQGSSTTITVNGTPVTSGSTSGSIDLTVGSNTITVITTAPDTTTHSTYTLTITRAASSDAMLSGLTISSGTLSPNFASGTTSYTASVTNTTNTITLTPTASQGSASTITVNGTPVTSGSTSGSIDLTVGSNTITVITTAPDTTTHANYTLTITRTTALVIAEVTPVSTPASDTTPVYIFNSTKAGTITYGGGCLSSTASAVVGDNTIVFNTLEEGVHSSCTIMVTDGFGNQSNVLPVASFTVDTSAPSAFNLVSPKDGGTVSVLNPAFSWDVAADGGSGLGKYELYIDDVMDQDNLQTNSAVSSKKLSCGNHSWFIKAVDNAGNSTDSGTSDFKIGCSSGSVAPAKPAVANISLKTSPSGSVDIKNLPSTVVQVAVSATEEFKNVSWEAIENLQNILMRYKDVLKLYLKFRASDGGVSDVITYDNPNASGGAGNGGGGIGIVLNDGDIIKTATSPDVYIIKYKNNKQYKRLILSPQVFKSYGHLKWSNLRIISEQQSESYAISNLVQVKGDPNIYVLTPEGDKGERKVLDPSQSYDPDSIYEINAVDRDSYRLIK